MASPACTVLAYNSRAGVPTPVLSDAVGDADRTLAPCGEAVATLVTRSVALLARRENGLTFAQLRAALEAPVRELRRALVEGLRSRQLRRVGTRIGTRYLVAH